MNRAILGEGGTVMQFVGDAVMAVFGAPFPQADHPDRALAAALAMHRSQAELNRAWEVRVGRSSSSASASRRVRRRLRCSDRRSAWSTRWWATR